MGLGHTFLRRLIARTPSSVDWYGLIISDRVSCGSLVLGTALGAAGLAICAPSPALFDSQNSDTVGEEQMKERFPNAFSRKGEGSGQQEPYMAYNRDGDRVPLADIVQRMKVPYSIPGPNRSKYISLCCRKEASPTFCFCRMLMWCCWEKHMMTALPISYSCNSCLEPSSK